MITLGILAHEPLPVVMLLALQAILSKERWCSAMPISQLLTFRLVAPSSRSLIPCFHLFLVLMKMSNSNTVSIVNIPSSSGQNAQTKRASMSAKSSGPNQQVTIPVLPTSPKTQSLNTFQFSPVVYCSLQTVLTSPGDLVLSRSSATPRLSMAHSVWRTPTHPPCLT